MAVRTSTASGDYGTGATWVGGVAPVEGDSVVIALGHTVTVAGTYIAGDDTTTAFTVNGTLKASRVANSSLTIKGQLLLAAATTATIDYGRRSTADPIPAGITANLILNYSAAMVNYKYGLFVADTSNFYACGVTKNVNARITSAVGVGGTTCTIDDATGWAVGDKIVMAESDGTATHYDDTTISTITPGAGTTATITFPATTYAHDSNCPIGNRSSNVNIKNYNTSTYSFICFRHTSTSTNNRREVDYVTLERVTSNSAQTNTQIFVSSSTGVVVTPFVTFSNNFFYNCNGTTSGLFMNSWNNGGAYNLDKIGWFDTAGTSAAIYTASGTFVGISNFVLYYTAGIAVQSAFSQGGQGCLYTDCTFVTSNGNFLINWTNGDGGVFTRCGFHTSLSGNSFISLNCGSANFVNCNFGKLAGTSPCPSLWGTPTFTFVNNTNTNASKGDWTMSDCNFGTPATSFNTFNSGSQTPNPQWILRVSNKNLDPLVQEIYTPNGNIVRDNTTKVSGVTSLKMSPTSATNAHTFVLYVPAPTGNKVGVSGYLWRDTANVTSVTLSGLGITPSVYTASGSLSANEQFFVSGTQTTGTDGFFTLTFSTIGTTGNVWIDAVSAPQAAAIDFGEFGYWNQGLPAQIISASYVSAGDVWNYLASNVTVSGSMGKVVKFIKTLMLSK